MTVPNAPYGLSKELSPNMNKEILPASFFHIHVLFD